MPLPDNVNSCQLRNCGRIAVSGSHTLLPLNALEVPFAPLFSVLGSWTALSPWGPRFFLFSFPTLGGGGKFPTGGSLDALGAPPDPGGPFGPICPVWPAASSAAAFAAAAARA